MDIPSLYFSRDSPQPCVQMDPLIVRSTANHVRIIVESANSSFRAIPWRGTSETTYRPTPNLFFPPEQPTPRMGPHPRIGAAPGSQASQASQPRCGGRQPGAGPGGHYLSSPRSSIVNWISQPRSGGRGTGPGGRTADCSQELDSRSSPSRNLRPPKPMRAGGILASYASLLLS